MLTTRTATSEIDPSSEMRPRSLAFVLGAVLAAFLFLLAARAFSVPAEAAHGFGIDMVAPADLFYMNIKGGRDLAWGLLFVGLLAQRRRAPLRLAVAAATVVPVVDMLSSILDPRGNVAYALGVHGSAALFGLVLVAVLRPRTEAV